MSASELYAADVPSSLAEAGLLIDGEWEHAASGLRIEVENPSRREVLASVARGDPEDVDRAVDAAAVAYPAWSRLPARERGLLLARIADDLAEIGEELARIIAAETERHPHQARGEAAPPPTCPVLRRGGQRAEGRGPRLGDGLLSYSVREPLGVVAAIVPWNAPVLLASLKIAMACARGTRWCSRRPRTPRWECCALRRSVRSTCPPGCSTS